MTYMHYSALEDKYAIIRNMEYRDKRVAIIGFGAEGKSAADFLRREHADISVFDEKEGPIPSLQSFDVVVRSPGVPLHHPRLSEINQKKTIITSVTKLFFDRCPCPIIGVTGTKGKGTTATLIYEMLINGGKDAYLGGNIGVPPLSFLPKLTDRSLVVLELSSFQLIDLTKSPHIGVVLMVTSEHQDYHRGQDEYREAKASLLKYQDKNDYAVVCADYEQSQLIGQQSPAHVYWYSRKGVVTPPAPSYPKRGNERVKNTVTACFVDDGMIVWHDGSTEEGLFPVTDIRIPGKHNWENVCAAVSTAKILHIPNKVIHTTVKQFTGLPHRLQLVGESGMVRYFDDSFSTTPETTIAAIEAFDEPKVLILGGSGKKSDFTGLASVIRQTEGIRAIIGIGEEWQRIKEALLSDPLYQMRLVRYDTEYAIQPPTTVKAHGKTIMEGCRTMQDIVAAARLLSQPGDVVLLSPACASFGMFKNYKDRGEQFIQEVHQLNRPDELHRGTA